LSIIWIFYEIWNSNNLNKIRSHIKNSIFVDLLYGVTPTQMYPRKLPDKITYQSYLGSIGLSNKHHLIVYDRSEFGFMAAARFWWLMKVLKAAILYLFITS
jgi:3-mercaptopyruvate sulfurtransferase SseA